MSDSEEECDTCRGYPSDDELDGPSEMWQCKACDCWKYRVVTTCEGNRFWEQEPHEHDGELWRCENCHQYYCSVHIMDDAWEERVKDNVFCCWQCYRWDQICADIG